MRGGAVITCVVISGTALLAGLARAQDKKKDEPKDSPSPAPAASPAAQDPGQDDADDKKKGPPRTDDAVHKALEALKVSRAFKREDFSDAVTFLQEVGRINCAIDPDLDIAAPITMNFNNVSLKDACDQIAKKVDAIYEVWEGLVFFTSKKSPKRIPPKADLLPATRELAEKTTLSMSFTSVDLEDVAKALTQKTKIKFVVAKDASAKITCRFEKIPLEGAIAVVCRLGELKLTKKDDTQVFEANNAKK